MTMTESRLPSGTEGVQARLLHELEPVVEANLNRHLEVAKPWMPHDYVPWSRGRDFAFLGGEDWKPEDSPLDPVAKTAMIVNLLTEDNLPSYHREIATRFGRNGAWGEWVGRWTAERAGPRSRSATTSSSPAGATQLRSNARAVPLCSTGTTPAASRCVRD